MMVVLTRQRNAGRLSLCTGRVVETRATQLNGRSISRRRGENATLKIACDVISRGKDEEFSHGEMEGLASGCAGHYGWPCCLGIAWPKCLEHNNRASWISRTWFGDTRTRDEQCLQMRYFGT